jgi:hypothetical protein
VTAEVFAADLELERSPALREQACRFLIQCGFALAEAESWDRLEDQKLGVDAIAYRDRHAYRVGFKFRDSSKTTKYSDEVTVETISDEQGTLGDLYKSHMDLYVYGFANPDWTGFTRLVMVNFQGLRFAYLASQLAPCDERKNEKHGSARFLAFALPDLCRLGLIVHEWGLPQ